MPTRPPSRTPAIVGRAQRAHPPSGWAPRSMNASTPSPYCVDSKRLCASETRCAASQSHAARRRPATDPIQRHALMQDAGRVRDVIIVGSGPAGHTAAIYAARAGLDTLAEAGLLAYRFVGTCRAIRSYTAPPSRRWAADRKLEFGTAGAESRCGRVTRVNRRPGR